MTEEEREAIKQKYKDIMREKERIKKEAARERRRAKQRMYNCTEKAREKSRARLKRFHEKHPNYVNESSNKLYRANPEKRNKYIKDWRAKDPNKHRTYWLRYKYKITLADKDRLLAAQGGRCAICRIDTPGGRTGWHLDHCHITKRIRGILCTACNLGLGMFKDNPERLITAAHYLTFGGNQYDPSSDQRSTPADWSAVITGSREPFSQCPAYEWLHLSSSLPC